MEKIIHYCWFGGKPLSKLALKCIKSWKKYLPDYKIIEWNEKNFDVNICPFVKQAYEKQKWAFVSDYARLNALYNYGGIYFDTDMEILKDIKHLTDKDLFIGYEENKKIAAGVIGVKEKNNEYIKELLQTYDKIEEFDEDIIYKFAIPNIITNEFSKYSKQTIDNIDIYDNNIYVYPEEYFYPINYSYSKKLYTKNTCMVHYYSASWVPKGEKFASSVYRTFGQKNGKRILNIYYSLCNRKNNFVGRIKGKIFNVRAYLSKHYKIDSRVEKIEEQIKLNQGEYVVISHPDWIGVGNVAKDNFKFNITIREVQTEKEAEKIAEIINKYNYNMVVFNGFALGWNLVAKFLRQINEKVTIKVLWHGSHALLSEWYDWCVFKDILTLYKENVINEIGFVKKSLYDFYKLKGYKVSFLMNNINLNVEDIVKNDINKKDDRTKIGLYASGGRWVKNFYNQVSAVSLVENVVLDCIPLTYEVRFFAENFDLDIKGKNTNIPRNELLARMAQNDVNVYVTFTECAPLLPLESLELGVPCITGNNHHYFEGTELEEYLVVDKVDNIVEIYNKVQYALENKEKIIQLYKDWKNKYNVLARESVDEFINIEGDKI